jgi:hypothetical protein
LRPNTDHIDRFRLHGSMRLTSQQIGKPIPLIAFDGLLQRPRVATVVIGAQ